MTVLYGVTLFLSAFLVFSLQPLMGRLLLPLLGGVPSVWITCQLVFQMLLLGGYAYAHLGAVRLPVRRQVLLHLIVLLVGAGLLPPLLRESQVAALAAGSAPLPWMLLTLAQGVGLPFLALSASAPLLLHWFSRTDHPDARDPHYLYAASNLGSLLALLAYPAWVEPHLGLRSQAGWWSAGYGLLVLLILGCAGTAWRQSAAGERAAPAGANPGGRPPDTSVGRWILWAAVPSSLFLGVTQFITTDLASIPLFWVIPLGVYLLTFVVAFARRAWIPTTWTRRALPPVGAAAAFLLLSRATEPIWLILALHLLFLFLAGLSCHGQLAATRPDAARLTRFYLSIAVGGMLGGLFNAILAPLAFRSVVEYPLALLLACALRPGAAREPWQHRVRDLLWAMLPGAAAAGLAALVLARGWEPAALRHGVAIGLPLILAFCFVDRPWRFALGIGAVALATWNFARPQGPVLRAERNFFGVSRVTSGVTGTFRFLVHGNTLHGRQFIDPARSREPLAYYHRSGPVGEIFEWVVAHRPRARVAVIGLGAGAMAAYAQPDQDWTFYEIDPAVIRIARDPRCFTFLQQCAAGAWRIVPGDARLQLAAGAGPAYDLIAIDAFSSDAIPVHLLTREALRLYRDRLADGGLLAFHISNRYVDLEPVLADLAVDAGMTARSWDDWDVPERDQAAGKEASQWILIGRRPEDLARVSRRTHWLPLPPHQPPRPWTDDYADVLSVLKWR